MLVKTPRFIRQGLAGLSLISVLFAIPAQAAISVGDVAPDFTLNDIFGNSYTLSELEGSVVVLFIVGYG